MLMRRADQSMGDLVQDRVADRIGRVKLCQRPAEPDLALVEAADTRPGLRPVKYQPPTAQAMLAKQTFSERASSLDLHALPASSRFDPMFKVRRATDNPASARGRGDCLVENVHGRR